MFPASKLNLSCNRRGAAAVSKTVLAAPNQSRICMPVPSRRYPQASDDGAVRSTNLLCRAGEQATTEVSYTSIRLTLSP
jgi:hypothetical protein